MLPRLKIEKILYTLTIKLISGKTYASFCKRQVRV